MRHPELTGRVGLIGDVHAEDEVLERVLAATSALRVDRWLCVGDIADGRGDLDRCCALLQKSNVACVRGNHDRWALAGTSRDLPQASDLSAVARAYLEQLPSSVEFDTALGRLMLCHGLGDSDMRELRPDTEGYALEVLGELHDLVARDDLALMVGGHTHEAMVREFGGLTVINAGTLRSKPDRLSSVSVLDLDRAAVERHELSDGALRLVHSSSLTRRR